MSELSIGWVGPGIMGRPMALNLLRASYPVKAFARRPEQLEPLVEAGATTGDSPAAVSATTDLTIVMVADTPDMLEVVTGENGIDKGAQPGHIVVDMSTVSPTETRAVAKQLEPSTAHSRSWSEGRKKYSGAPARCSKYSGSKCAGSAMLGLDK